MTKILIWHKCLTIEGNQCVAVLRETKIAGSKPFIVLNIETQALVTTKKLVKLKKI